MAVHPKRVSPAPSAVLAGGAVAADVLGRLLAPSLLKDWPLVVVGLSPSDPHMLLARVEPRLLLVGVVLAVRIGRALLVYRAVGDGMRRLRSERLRRLLAPAQGSRWGDRSAVAAVILLPGMAGAVVAARQRMRPATYLVVLTLSTVAGVALTLSAASLFKAPLHAAGDWVAHRSVFVTAVVAVMVGLHFTRRLRRRVVPAEPSGGTQPPMVLAVSSASASEIPATPATQQATGAAVRTERWAASPARARIVS